MNLDEAQLGKYNDVFTDVLGKTSFTERKVDLTENKPVWSKPYPLPYAVLEEPRGE